MKNELEQFLKFKKTYNFVPKQIIEKDGIKYCDGEQLTDEDGKELGESANWVNVGYNIKSNYSKTLSNLFPYTFNFRGKELKSIEGFFQGIKFKDIKMQNMILEYSGVNAVYIKIASDYDWKEEGNIYWQGQAINRFSEEYDNLIDELYISAIQNPLYRNVLKKCDKYILHEIGALNKEDSVFTRYEFEKQLNCLKDFLKERDKR